MTNNLAGYPTHPRSLRQEPYGLPLAHTKTPTPALREPNSQLRRKAAPACGPCLAETRTQTITRASPEPPLSLLQTRTRHRLLGASTLPQPAAAGPGRARDTESPRSFGPTPSILNATPNDLHPPYPPRYPPPTPDHDGQPPPLARRNQEQETRTRKSGAKNKKHEPQPPPRRRPTARSPPNSGPPRGVRGASPGRALRAPARARRARA